VDIDHDKTYAVVSGDIVGSSKLPPSERADLLQIMKHASNELRDFLAQSVPLSVDIYAGDSWQLLLCEPGDALRAGLFYRGCIIAATKKKVDTRLVVALGKVDFVPGERVSEGDGEAFRLSGRLLQDAVQRQRMHFVANEIDDSDVWDATFGLLDVVARRWSARQAQAVVCALQGWSQAKIAAHLTPPIERQSVANLLVTANWQAIERTIAVFARTFCTTKG
jgi:hypothetical protein